MCLDKQGVVPTLGGNDLRRQNMRLRKAFVKDRKIKVYFAY